MRIVIVGAGRVGSTLAQNLASEANDITVVDQDPGLLHELQERLDIKTIQGFGAHPDTLRNAGAEYADMVIAVTGSDETNMAACQVCYSLFHTPTKIARVRAAEYLNDPETKTRLFNDDNIPIDMIISPEQLVTDHIRRLIKYPGALQVLDFADGKLRLVGVKAFYGGPLVGHELRDIRKHMPNIDSRIAAIYRRGRGLIPEGNTVIEADDEIFFLAARKDIRKVMAEVRRVDKPARHIMIAGGGNIGLRLAKALERSNHVKLLEQRRPRIHYLNDLLDRTLVLHGDAANEELLLEENIQHVDVFCAVTNDDEANILSAMLAKRLGAKRVMALINRPAYVDLVQGESVIDIAVSPQQTTIGALLSHVRRGDVAAVHTLRQGAAEAIEAVAHGTMETSKVVGRAVEDVPLPKGATISAIVRGEQVMMAHHDTVIQPEDHVVVFLTDKTKTGEVERLFEVAPTYI
ncbi:MAG: Trk system potassium transporter TrkA [Gammaproteobacteria bacterium]|nr:Trk system potassium transporter TrkA [Gammaproteobacteria bacterium]